MRFLSFLESMPTIEAFFCVTKFFCWSSFFSHTFSLFFFVVAPSNKYFLMWKIKIVFGMKKKLIKT